MDRRSLTVSPPELAEDSLGFFRWGQVAGKVLVTTDAGDWAFFTAAEFAELLSGRIVAGHPRFVELQRKALLRDGLDLDALADRMARRNRHMRSGPHVHVVTLTLRRSANGVEQPTGESADLDMSAETAEQVVDLALASTAPSITFDLQRGGGEPLLNFEGLRHLVEFAQSRNRRTVGKTLTFRLLSNLTAMSEATAEWLIANDVRLSATLDGPASVHDGNRRWIGGSAHADVVGWIDYFHRRYAELGRDPEQERVEARPTTTRQTLAAGREVVDEYVTRGLHGIQLLPLDAWRVGRDAWAAIGYTIQEYLEFYRRTLDYILELNQRGVDITERRASMFLMKILTSDDSGTVDIQSPCTAGTGQVAYNVDGRVFPCDEARLVDANGDAIFELGHVRDLTIADIVRHPTVRAIAAASLLEAQPMCADCWNKPFCGFNPVRNFLSQGDLFGQRPHCLECKEHMAVSTRLFELLGNESDAATAEVLTRWTTALNPRLASDRGASPLAP